MVQTSKSKGKKNQKSLHMEKDHVWILTLVKLVPRRNEETESSPSYLNGLFGSFIAKTVFVGVSQILCREDCGTEDNEENSFVAHQQIVFFHL